MLAGLDSSFATPSAAQVAQAKATGVSGWSGYLATKPGVGLAHPWTQANFQTVLSAGLFSIAFCSGWDDPAACKNQAAAWGVRLCLDVEGGIRGNGAWVQPWLDISGAGLYGNSGVHLNRRAAFHILAAYPGSNPNATWYSGYPRPAGPVGWQWQGTHSEFGATVDRGWYDDWFAQGGSPVADLGAGYWQGVAVATSALLGRTRENDPPGTDTDALVAGDLIANPNDFINQVHGITTSTEFQNRFVGLKWILDNLTDGKGNVDPARLAAALGVNTPAPAPTPVPDLSGVAAALTAVESALSNLTTAIQAVK